jgi:hypothetical protein
LEGPFVAQRPKPGFATLKAHRRQGHAIVAGCGRQPWPDKLVVLNDQNRNYYVFHLTPIWPALLEALPYNYAFLSSPVVDPAFVAEVIPAFFAAVANSKLPKF